MIEKKQKSRIASKINSYPADWILKRIGEMTKTIAGGTPSTKDSSYWGGKIPWMNSGELNLKRVFKVEGRITEKGLNNSSTKLIPPHCVLVGLAGQGKTRGTVAMNMIELCTNQSIAAIYPSKYFIEDYLYYNLDFRYNELRLLSTGEGGRGGLNLQIINSLLVPLPPIAEQKKIAAFINIWDDAINKSQLLINQKELQKKWLIHNLLTAKKRLNGFNGVWEKHPYKNLIKTVKRPIVWDDNELYNLISIKRRSGGIFLRESLYGHQIKVKDLRNTKEGDFLFSKMQIVHGASALVTKEYANTKISGSYIAVVPKDTNLLSMDFFNWLSHDPYFYHQTFISSYGVHIEKMTFDFEMFLSLEMKLPSLEEQKAITKVLDESEYEIQILKNIVDNLIKQKRGLMQQLLTGITRLNDLK